MRALTTVHPPALPRGLLELRRCIVPHRRGDAWRRRADDPATPPHLIACQMGQGLFVIKHRAEIANVEPAFTEVKLTAAVRCCRRAWSPGAGRCFNPRGL